MTEELAQTAGEPRAKMVWLFPVLMLGIPAAMIGAAYLLAALPERRDMALCDEAIKATLKAPSTYRRIEGPGTFRVASGSSYMVEYDAANGFGVPIRGKGACKVNADRTSASWVEFNF
jgi:hypothetical protein